MQEDVDDKLRSGEIVATAATAACCSSCFAVVDGESCFLPNFLSSTVMELSFKPSPRCVLVLMFFSFSASPSFDFGLALAWPPSLPCIIGLVLEKTAAEGCDGCGR